MGSVGLVRGLYCHFVRIRHGKAIKLRPLVTHEEYGVLRDCILGLLDGKQSERCIIGTASSIPYLLCMIGVVPAQASYCAYVLNSQRREQKADVDDVVSYLVLSENVSRYNLGLSSLSNIADAMRHDWLAIVCSAIPGQEADESLFAMRQSLSDCIGLDTG
jgi:hypothetical protein